MIRIVIVEAKALVRAGLVRLLEDVRGIEVAGEAADSQSLFDLLREQSAQVLLLDVNIPELGALETARRALRIRPNLKVLALSAHDDEPYADRLLQGGVSGYVSKDVAAPELVSAIRKVQVGQRYLSLDIAQRLALQSLASPDRNPFSLLSCRELEVAMMVVGCRRVQDISDQLCLSSKTVNSYRYRIFDKLNIRSDVELTHLAFKHRLLESMAPTT